MKYISIPLFISAVVHLLIGGVLLFISPSRSNQDPILFEVITNSNNTLSQDSNIKHSLPIQKEITPRNNKVHAKNVNFAPTFDPQKAKPHVYEGAEKLEPSSESTGQLWGRQKSLQEWSQYAPALTQIQQFLDEIIYYEPSLVEQKIEGTVNLEMEVSATGEIVKIKADKATGPEKLVGSVLGIILKKKKQLACHMQNSKMNSSLLPVIVNIHFSLIANPQVAQQQIRVGNHMNTINLYRTFVKPLPIQIATLEDAQNGNTTLAFNLDLLGPIADFFKKKESPRARQLWDLKFKLKEAINECNSHGAEGACYFVGITLKELGEHKLALEFFNLSCQYGYALACKKIEQRLESSPSPTPQLLNTESFPSDQNERSEMVRPST